MITKKSRNKKLSIKKAIETVKREDNGIILASVIKKVGKNDNTFNVLQFTVKNPDTGKFEYVQNLYNINFFFWNVIDLKKPVEFNSGDQKVAFLKAVPMKGHSIEELFAPLNQDEVVDETESEFDQDSDD